MAKKKAHTQLPDREHPTFSQLNPQIGAIVTKRRGKTVWRIPGKAGADLPAPPRAMANAKLEAEFLATCQKIVRYQRMVIANRDRVGVSARQLQAEIRADFVWLLYQESALAAGNRATNVAKVIQLTPRRVREIIAKKKAEATESR
jgi:hypothetical protein